MSKKRSPKAPKMSAFQTGAQPSMGSPDENEAHQEKMAEMDAKGHLNTLMDAEEIKKDPEKMKRVHALAGRHANSIKAIRSIQDVKDAYNEKFGGKIDDSKEEV